MQKDQLFHPQVKRGGGAEIGIQKILQMVQKTNNAQRREEIIWKR